MSLTLEQARAMVEAGIAAERSSPERRIAIAVCDAGGHPMALLRETDAAPLLAHIAQAKAFTVIAYGKPSGPLTEWAEESPLWFHGVSRVAQSRMGSPLTGGLGGVLIRGADGEKLGAAGVAGEAGWRDVEIAELAIRAAGLTPDAGA